MNSTYRCLRFGFALYGLVAPLAAQEIDLATGVAVEVALVQDGESPAAVFNYRVASTGLVFVTAWSEELDPHLQILDAGGKPFGKDSDSGGGTTAFVRLELEAGRSLKIHVAPENATGPGGVSLVVHELPASSAAALERLEEARAVFAEAGRLKLEGNYDFARAELSIALDILLEESEEVLSEQAAGFVEQIGVYAYNVLRDVEQAHRAFSAALEWTRALFPPTHDTLHVRLQNVAGMLIQLGRVDEAYPVAVAAWQGRARSLGPEHLDTLFTRMNVANTLYQLGRMAEAEGHFTAIFEVYSRELEQDDGRLTMIQRNLGSLRFELGDMRGAYALMKRAHDSAVRTLPEDDNELLAVRANLARLLSERGDTLGALALEQRIYGVYQRKLPADSLDLQLIRQNLALSLKKVGDYLGALELQEAVLEGRLRKLPAGHADILSARSAIAITRRDLGDHRSAHAIFQEVNEARAVLEPGNPDRLRSMGNLAVTLHDLGRHEEAFELEGQVLEQQNLALAPDSPALLRTELNHAGTLSAMGRHEEALELAERVYARRAEELPNEGRVLQHTRQMLAMIRYNAGDVDGAIVLEEDVYRILSKTLPAEARDLTNAQLNLAVKISAYRDAPRGRSLILEALDGARRRMGQLSTTLGTRGLEEANRDSVRLLHVLLSVRGPDADRMEADREDLQWIVAFRGLVDRRARALEWMRREREQHDELDTALVNAREARSAYLRGLERDDLAPAAVLELRRGMENLEDALSRIAGKVEGSLNIASQVPLAKLLSRIPEGAAVILTKEFFKFEMRGSEGEPLPPTAKGEPTVALFVAEPSGAVTRFDLEHAGGFGSVCLGIRTALTNGDSDTEVVDATLVQALKPVFDSLPAGTDTIYICTEGALASIPWAALKMDGATYLGDRFRILYLENLTALAPRAPQDSETSFLVLGGVDYGGEPQELPSIGVASRGIRRGAVPAHWEPLPRSAQEAEAIHGVFERNHPEGHAVFLTGREASRGAFLGAVEGKRFVHLATHSFVAPEEEWNQGGDSHLSIEDLAGSARASGLYRGLLSEIVFAGANREEVGQKALLSAFELAGLNLSHCELAVLSACETNVGPRLAGEAATGMNRALQMAGARNTITSLWEVRDDSAKAFFGAFYEALWGEGLEIGDAFDAAREKMISRRFGVQAWAGFVLYVSGPRR